MKTQTIILSVAIGLSCACQQEELTPVQPVSLDEVASSVSDPSTASLSSMKGMIGEIRLNDSGEGQCVVANDPGAMASYTQLMDEALSDENGGISSSIVPTLTALSNINVTYVNFTPQAQTAFQSAVDEWSGLLSSAADINVLAFFVPLGPGVLGSAGSTFIVRDAPGLQRETWYSMALADKLAGTDLIPGEFDILAFFSSEFPNWYFGTDGNTPAGQFDFRSVVLHELCHGLGFFGSATVNDQGIGSLGFGTPFPVIYDRFAITRPGKQLTKENKFPNPSELLGQALTGDQILFSGENVIATTRGDRARLFTFPVWIQGSSYSHLDEFTYLPGDENALMTPFIGTGESYAGPGPIVLSIFDDIGWNGKVKKPVGPPN